MISEPTGATRPDLDAVPIGKEHMVANIETAPPNGEEPWVGYDGQPAKTIERFLGKSSPTQAQAVRDYESARQNRAEVIAAVDKRLAQWPAA